jgi:hypothetical protein
MEVIKPEGSDVKNVLLLTTLAMHSDKHWKHYVDRVMH